MILRNSKYQTWTLMTDQKSLLLSLSINVLASQVFVLILRDPNELVIECSKIVRKLPRVRNTLLSTKSFPVVSCSTLSSSSWSKVVKKKKITGVKLLTHSCINKTGVIAKISEI